MLSLVFHQTNSVFAVLILLMVHLSRLIWHLSLVLICAQMWLSPVAGRHLSEPRKMGVTCLCFFLRRAIKMLPIFLSSGRSYLPLPRRQCVLWWHLHFIPRFRNVPCISYALFMVSEGLRWHGNGVQNYLSASERLKDCLELNLSCQCLRLSSNFNTQELELSDMLE